MPTPKFKNVTNTSFPKYCAIAEYSPVVATILYCLPCEIVSGRLLLLQDIASLVAHCVRATRRNIAMPLRACPQQDCRKALPRESRQLPLIKKALPPRGNPESRFLFLTFEVSKTFNQGVRSILYTLALYQMIHFAFCIQRLYRFLRFLPCPHVRVGL